MIIIKARAMGMCFGVRAAIKTAMELPNPNQATIHGSLVHNAQVVQRLADRGFELHSETNRDSIGSRIDLLITAHGISNRERDRLKALGKNLIDTTCPLVKRIHDSAQMLQRQGYFVVVIGKRGHVEVQGLIGDLDAFVVVESPEEVQPYAAQRIGVVCQSTTSPLTAEAVMAEITERNRDREIRYLPTICQPTLERQLAVLDLLEEIDALVVVGGADSNNSRQLARLAELKNIPCCFVQTADGLDEAWFKAFERVGLTAGTSTPDDVIEAVHQRLLEIAALKPGTRLKMAPVLI